MKTIQKDIQESLVRDFREIAKRAADNIPVEMLHGVRVTESGRPVAFSFRERSTSKRPTNIYMDDLLTAATGEARRLYVVGEMHAFVGRTDYEKRKSGRRRQSSRVKVHACYDSSPHASIAVKPKNPKIPAAIKRLALYYLDNIRKIVCPKKGAKPALSTSSNAVVSGLGVLIASQIGVHSSVALAAASSVMIVIVTAGKGAFCDMTRKEVEAAISRL